MIFLNCKNESIVQVNDKTRIDVSDVFFSGDEITGIEIKPEASGSFVSVFNQDQSLWYLDWAYATDGEKDITIQATDGLNTYTKDYKINVVTVEDDNLYSSDSMIFTVETELKKYISPGRNSYLNVHREAQARILDYLDRKRIWNLNGTRITKDQLNIDGDIQRWSLYESLVIIYEDLIVSVGDKFRDKADKYSALRNDFRAAGALRIDKDKDGEIQSGSEIMELKTFQLLRR